MTRTPDPNPWKSGGNPARASRSGCLRRLAGGLILGMALAGNTGLADQTAVIRQPQNVYWGSPVLPVDLKRVLVLPLACDTSPADLSEGCAALNPILLTELIKTQKFEVTSADAETVRRLTGRLTWNGTEILPADFFDSLQRFYGCDAVLFCQLTVYRAYPPLATGWRMKLVDARTRVLWAVDDVFNAPRPIESGPEVLELLGLPFLSGAPDRWKQENSPRAFGQSTLAALFTTLPYRQEKAKVSARAADTRNGPWSKNHQ